MVHDGIDTQAVAPNPSERGRLSANARAFAQAHYDLNAVCLPQQLKWVEELGRAA